MLGTRSYSTQDFVRKMKKVNCFVTMQLRAKCNAFQPFDIFWFDSQVSTLSATCVSLFAYIKSHGFAVKTAHTLGAD